MTTEQKPVRSEGPVTWEEMRTLFKMESQFSSQWQPVTGGILAIVSGYLNFLVGVTMMSGATVPTFFSFVASNPSLGIVLILLGIYSAIGGSLGIGRRGWGWALAGSITASVFPSIVTIPGVLSLIWISLGKAEFKR